MGVKRAAGYIADVQEINNRLLGRENGCIHHGGAFHFS